MNNELNLGLFCFTRTFRSHKSQKPPGPGKVSSWLFIYRNAKGHKIFMAKNCSLNSLTLTSAALNPCSLICRYRKLLQRTSCRWESFWASVKLIKVIRRNKRLIAASFLMTLGCLSWGLVRFLSAIDFFVNVNVSCITNAIVALN